ncbi:mechanosensitive ion channel [Oscillatoria sp. FACHB-1407]|uniref:mechanosensitive ion channel n=1 Tax=Oscillatoria sp. FACHB-1407 TaxID=2692847 RepID=UPI001684C21F|nr:mechanosensitive ion channel [Oscillatoria sp. FACHB-1407]MBD2464839.1 mechanosensitive ion channel [Oscillatoria sp. FACHB-1407]
MTSVNRLLPHLLGISLPGEFNLDTLWNTLIALAGGILILIIGWIIAAIAASVTRGLLRRTDLDNRLANMMMPGERANAGSAIEKWVPTIVFWIIFIIAIVAFLDALQLTTVSQPLNNFLNQIFAFLPRLGAAALLVGVAWLVATIARALVVRTATSFGIDQRLSQADPDAPPENQFLLSQTLGNALYWFVFLFFLPLILGVLNLRGPLEPVQNLLNNFLGALPRIVEAIVIALIGWFIARIVRGIVTNLLAAAGTDRLGSRFGLRQTTGGSSLSGIIGTVVYVLILIPPAIAALDALEIEAISAPATAMLNQILQALPQIFTAVLILVVAYVVGQFIADLVSSVLTSFGFNNIFSWLGLQPTTTPAPTPVDPSATVLQPGQPTQPTTRTPSEIVGIIAWVGVMLFAIVAATNILNIPALTAIVSGLLLIFGRVLVGLVVFAVGLYLANLAFSLVTSSGGRQARILGQTARVAIIALASAMALQQMGVATNIVNLAFGLLLGAIAVAIALAFGLGGRDVAAEELRGWLASFRRDS